MSKALRVITLFSGYDSQALALNRLGLPYDLAAWCEIDRHAITAHNALFPQWKDRNLGDVSKVDWAEWHRQHPQPIDLLTYSSPCQDFSSAGLQRGGEEGSGTRSGLLWETERAVRELRPRHLVFENVAGLVSDKFINLFNRWQARLNGYGYTNFQQLMNAKDYGVPQNRLRIFMVSILDCQQAYYFSMPFPLTRRLKDVLEQNVDERYYLSDERVKGLLKSTEKEKKTGNGFAFAPLTGSEEYAHTVLTSGCNRKTDNFIAEPQMLGWTRSNTGKGDPTYHPVNVANCVTAEKASNTQNYVIVPTIIEDFYGTVREPRVYTDEAPTLRADRTGLMTIEHASVAKDNYLIVPRSKRQESIKAKVMPNGDIRCYRDVPGKPGVSEMQFTHPDNESPTVTCEAQIKVIEPAVLAPVRTEYGKAIRKQYGDNNLPESRHNLTQLLPKQDGTSNTITSVAKDNYLIVPEATKEGYAVVPEGGVFDASYPDSKTRRGRVQEGGTVSPTIMAGQNELLRYEGIRIRRLTERELYRLMDVEEKDIDILLAARIPRTQHAKLAGNSIVVACLYYIFRNLFVDTEPEAGTQTKLF